MSSIGTITVETPKNLESIFSLDCFKFNDMKDLLKNIYAYLHKFGYKLNELDAKFATIPNFDGLTNAIKDLEKRATENDKYNKNFKETYEQDKIESYQRVDNLRLEIDGRYMTLEERVTLLEQELDLLKKRPISEGNVDLSGCVSMEDFHDLLERLKLTEKRNIE
jgi:predicted RNase H-like nuclease (RuvC/YqgF family)